MIFYIVWRDKNNSWSCDTSRPNKIISSNKNILFKWQGLRQLYRKRVRSILPYLILSRTEHKRWNWKSATIFAAIKKNKSIRWWTTTEWSEIDDRRFAVIKKKDSIPLFFSSLLDKQNGRVYQLLSVCRVSCPNTHVHTHTQKPFAEHSKSK